MQLSASVLLLTLGLSLDSLICAFKNKVVRTWEI